MNVEIVIIALVLLGVPVYTYLLVGIASTVYFRAKLDYHRSVIEDLNRRSTT